MQTNIASEGIASQSTGYNGNRFPARLAIDNDLGNFTHTASSDRNASWTLDYSEPRLFEEFVLHNRDSNNENIVARLRDITMSIEDAAGATLYSSELNQGNVLSSPETLIVTLPQAILGSRLVIHRAGSGGNSDNNNALSLGEVIVRGCSAN